jgi:YHS domain-containing protein
MFNLLRLILLLLVIRAIWLLVRGMLQGAGYHRGPINPPGMKLVRDPVCGLYLPPAKALTLQSGDATAFFCSERCRDQWRQQAGHHRADAHG